MYRNPKEIKYCNIDKWHEKGYTGKDIKVAFIDSMISNTIDRDFISVPFYKYSMRYSHGDRTIDIFHQICPDSKVYLLPKCPTNKEYNVDWIIQEGITIINVSMTGAWFTDEEIDILKNHNIKIIASSGNDSYEGRETPWLRDDKIMAVGAVHLSEKGIPELADYSSWGNGYVDCVGFSHLFVSEGFNDETLKDGTSYSAPWISGMVALYEQYYKEKNNSIPHDKEIREFIYRNTEDLGDKGKDLKYGNGLFILPINILEDKEEEIINKSYSVMVSSSINLSKKLNTLETKLDFKYECIFTDGFDIFIYNLGTFINPITAVALKNNLLKEGLNSYIEY